MRVTHRNGDGPDDGDALEEGQRYAFALRAVNARGASWISNRAKSRIGVLHRRVATGLSAST